MKILYFQHSILFDGSTNAFLNYLEEANKTAEVKVVLARKSVRLEELERMGINYIIIPFRFSSYRKFNRWYKNVVLSPLFFIFTITLNAIAILRLIPIVKAFDPDIIHSNVGPLRIGFYLSKLFKKKHVWHLREFQGTNNATYPIPNMSFYKHLLQKSYSIAISNCIEKYYDLDSNKSIVIYDGVFNSKISYAPPSYQERMNSILFVGRVEPAKGVEDLFKAFASISNISRDLRLDLLGLYDKSYRDYLESKYINPNNLSGRVFFHGATRDVASFMKKSKVTVVSSLLEGFGFVVAESMYNYCMVIGNDNTGIKEQFDRCDDTCNEPISRRYSTHEELVTQLLDVLNLPEELYGKETEELHKCVVNLYDKERYARNIIDFYATITQ